MIDVVRENLTGTLEIRNRRRLSDDTSTISVGDEVVGTLSVSPDDGYPDTDSLTVNPSRFEPGTAIYDDGRQVGTIPGDTPDPTDQVSEDRAQELINNDGQAGKTIAQTITRQADDSTPSGSSIGEQPWDQTDSTLGNISGAVVAVVVAIAAWLAWRN